MKPLPVGLRCVALVLWFAAGCARTDPEPEVLSPGGEPPAYEPDRPVLPETTPKAPAATKPAEEANPTRPTRDDGAPLGFTEAPRLEGVEAILNRDSAVVLVPPVEGARDYRVFALPPTTEIGALDDGREVVAGTEVFCAGYRQHNTKASAALELLRQIEMTGLAGPTRVVVEAIDATCPFTGLLGVKSERLQVTNTEVPAADRVAFSIQTEEELRARYGSLIHNGHGRGGALAAPGEAVNPRVLARTTVTLTPLSRDTQPSAFFEGFEAPSEPRLVGRGDLGGRASNAAHYQTERLNLYGYDFAALQPFVRRGQLHMLLADRYQDVFASTVLVPRRTFALDDSRYLHVRFEVGSNATGRRYWLLMVCGAEEPGETLDANGALVAPLINTPFFYQPDGKNPSVAGWSCLQLFPRDGSPFALPPSGLRPESDLRVMVNRANQPERTSVVNVSPPQYRNQDLERPGWFRQMDGARALTGPILDDQLLLAPRTRYDAYIRRDRLILYVNGEERLCNDFPTARLTMAEAAVGFSQVLYHSAAERLEFSRRTNDRTGQRYYLENTPYADARTWDNLGLTEGVDAPPDFSGERCYKHP